MLVVSTSKPTAPIRSRFPVVMVLRLLRLFWTMIDHGRMGNAMEEFSNARETKINHPVKNYNYTQIFRTPFDQSMTSEAEAVVTSEKERTQFTQD